MKNRWLREQLARWKEIRMVRTVKKYCKSDFLNLPKMLCTILDAQTKELNKYNVGTYEYWTNEYKLAKERNDEGMIRFSYDKLKGLSDELDRFERAKHIKPDKRLIRQLKK